MALKVVGPRLLVKVAKISKKSAGGIHLIDDYIEKETAWQTDGEVVGLGSTAFSGHHHPFDGKPWCKVGDHVTFSRYGAVRTKTEDTEAHELWILNDRDVLAVKEA